MRRTVKNWLFVAVLALILSFLIEKTPALAQELQRWAQVKRIPSIADDTMPPLLLADSNETVHALYAQFMDGGRDRAIYYRQWTRQQGWTKPEDIILLGDSSSDRAVQGLYLDTSSVLHMVYYHVGGDPDPAIYYSRAPIVNAGRAPAWSSPKPVGINAGPFASASLAGNNLGHLILLYSGKAEGPGLYETHSTDWGETWNNPVLVQPISEREQWPISIRTAYDDQGFLHAVWSIADANASGVGIYYTRFDPEIQGWSQVQQLAVREEGDYSANWPSIFISNNRIMVLYQDGFPATKWMRISTDGGISWTSPVRPFPHEGEYENPVLLQDSSGRLHMLLGNRTVDPEIHGMWHSLWLNDRWSQLEPIVIGPKTGVFDPSAPSAVVSQGNVILATWRNDVFDKNGIWFSYIFLEAPETPIVQPALPTPTPTEPVVTPTVVTSGALTSADTPALNGLAETGPVLSSGLNPLSLIMTGVAPVSLIVLLLILYRIKNKDK